MSDKDRTGNAANDQDTSSTGDQGQGPDYGKMDVQGSSGTAVGSGKQTDRTGNSVGGASIPEGGQGSGEPRGGISTSNSTVSSGGTTGGGTMGPGATPDRGDTPVREMTMQSEDLIKRNAGGYMGGETASTPQNAPGGEVTTAGDAKSDRGSKGSDPLSREEADKINEDVRGSSGASVPNDVGWER
jgi:hypothetical protein